MESFGIPLNISHEKLESFFGGGRGVLAQGAHHSLIFFPEGADSNGPFGFGRFDFDPVFGTGHVESLEGLNDNRFQVEGDLE